ncbi:MAG: hypothetical protein LBN94_00080 [Puniceicoccales bacterium]|jgi:tRNA threonylcarbamoyladenosine biosynthesis protein TsaB|nr:hypothetical protein [Puniceicoccales bacterium]
MSPKILLIDAATNLFQTGIFQNNQWLFFRSSSEDNLAGFFKLIKPIFEKFTPSRVIFCEGPGKLIGIRSTLMLLRIFKMIHPRLQIDSYTSLALAHHIDGSSSSVCVAKNRDQYYVFQDNRIGLVDRKTLSALGRPIHCLETQRNLQPDGDFISVKYDLQAHVQAIQDFAIPNESITTAYDPQDEYKKWTSLRREIPETKSETF